VGTEGGKCRSVSFRKCVSVKNEEGRFDPKFDDSVKETAECSTVLYCIGQKPDWGKLLEGTSVELDGRGLVICDPLTYQTSEYDIFAGGDIYTGQKFCIDAIAAGKQGAISINRAVW
jgi:NADPH-dependent glutamate synthase beta subunit-like oxidoreductase